MNAPLPPTLADAWIDSSVRDTHPDYVAILIAASGLCTG